MLLAYLGFPFYDIADAAAAPGRGHRRIRSGEGRSHRARGCARDPLRAGRRRALKGIQFNSFGAFFSRAYRENDYLWGRLHGADRLIDIVASTLPAGSNLQPGAVAGIKRDIFRAILAEERGRLTHVPELFEALEREIG